MTSRTLRTVLAGAGLTLAVAIAVAAPVSYQADTGKIGWNSAEARRGADDPAGHNANDDRGGATGVHNHRQRGRGR